MAEFWKTLDDSKRRRLFALMRQLTEEAQIYHGRGRETPGTIPVGAAFFDEVLQGAMRDELVSALCTASSLEAAVTRAEEKVRLWVKNHNKRRSDVNWQRWSESGQADLAHLVWRVREALKDL